MAWTALPTYTDGTALTAAMLEAIKANLNETAPAKATVGSWPKSFWVSGTNTIAAREIRDDIVTTLETTTNTGYVDLSTTGPAVTLTTGVFALCFPGSRLFNSAGGVSYASFDVTGTTIFAATDGRGVANQGTDDIRAGSTQLLAVTAGTNNIFTMRYRVSSGTGTFQSRRLTVMAL